MNRVVVVGGGSIGERHVRCFQNTGRCDVSLCEVNEEIGRQVVGRYQLPALLTSLDGVSTDQFDAAVICTPAQLHVRIATQLVDSGLSVLIEKPLAVSRDGVDDLIALATNRKVAVAYVMRQHPALLAMKAAIDSGQFGKPVQVVYVGGQHFPFYRPAYRDIYYTSHANGGGAIQDALTHMVNAAEWLVGPVSRLVADAEHCVLDGVSVEDTVHLITRHRSESSSDVLGSFSLNQHQAVNESTLTVMCERGSARFEMHRTRWLSSTEPNSQWTVEAEFILERDDLFQRQASAFLDYLEGHSPASCALQDADQTLRVNIAALESARTGQWVTL